MTLIWPNSSYFDLFRFFFSSEFEISSPESNDSGIHSDERLNRHMSNNDIMDSLYSSVSSEIKKTKTTKEMFGSSDEIDLDQNIVHVEQHALPLGWIRCCGN